MEGERVSQRSTCGSQTSKEDEMMRSGYHFIADGFSQYNAHNPSNPRFIQTDNMDFEKNMEITSVELMYTAAETGNADVSNDSIFFVLARSEEGATPRSASDTFNPQYGLRMNDPDIIAWGFMEPNQPPQVILSPHRLVPTDMWVNAWSLSNAAALITVQNSIGYAINMRMRDLSGTEGLLQTTLSVAAQEN
jgi:hypothetical protein